MGSQLFRSGHQLKLMLGVAPAEPVVAVPLPIPPAQYLTDQMFATWVYNMMTTGYSIPQTWYVMNLADIVSTMREADDEQDQLKKLAASYNLGRKYLGIQEMFANLMKYKYRTNPITIIMTTFTPELLLVELAFTYRSKTTVVIKCQSHFYGQERDSDYTPPDLEAIAKFILASFAHPAQTHNITFEDTVIQGSAPTDLWERQWTMCSYVCTVLNNRYRPDNEVKLKPPSTETRDMDYKTYLAVLSQFYRHEVPRPPSSTFKAPTRFVILDPDAVHNTLFEPVKQPVLNRRLCKTAFTSDNKIFPNIAALLERTAYLIVPLYNEDNGIVYAWIHLVPPAALENPPTTIALDPVNDDPTKLKDVNEFVLPSTRVILIKFAYVSNGRRDMRFELEVLRYIERVAPKQAKFMAPTRVYLNEEAKKSSSHSAQFAPLDRASYVSQHRAVMESCVNAAIKASRSDPKWYKITSWIDS